MDNVMETIFTDALFVRMALNVSRSTANGMKAGN